jgi:hypothetical protein
MQCGFDLAVAGLISPHDPIDRVSRKAGSTGVAEHHPSCQVGHELRVELEPVHLGVWILELQSEKATMGRRELILAAAGKSCLYPFELARGLRDLHWIGTLAPGG